MCYRVHMDRSHLEDALSATELHLAEAECQIANHRERMAQLEREGHDTDDLADLLAGWEEVLAAHTANRDRLRRELAH